MRIDKFLKVSRLIKRRTLAKEMTDKGRVLINNKPSKAGTAVSVGDEITLNYGHRIVIVKVNALLEHAAKDDASKMYEVIEDKKREEI